jgi:hypothetical protein
LEAEQAGRGRKGHKHKQHTFMKKFSPAFDFYPERFWFAVEGWTDSEIVRYWRLLSQQWMRDGLPADPAALQELARGKVSDRVLEKFPIAADGRRRNPFLEKGRSDQMERMAASKFKNTRAAWGRNHPGQPLPDYLQSRAAFEAWLQLPEEERQTTATGAPQAHHRRAVRAATGPPSLGAPTTHHSPLTPDHDLAETQTHSAGGPEPEGWPKSEEACRSQAVSIGVDPEFAAAVWNEHDSTGDFTRADQHGNRLPILKWPGYLKARWTYRQQRGHEARAMEKHKAELRGQGQRAAAPPNARDERGQRPNEIKTDVTAAKIPRITPRTA